MASRPLALGGCTAIFTTPLAPVNAPLWLLRAWRGYRRSNRRELGFSLALVAALALCVAVTENLGSNAKMGIRLSFFDQPSGYLLRFVNLLTDRVAALILASGALAAVRTAGTAAVADVALAALVALVVASLPGRDGNLPGLLAALYLFVAMLLLTSLGRLLWALLPLQNFPARFTIPPAAMLVLAVVIALDGLPRGWLRGLLILGITALLVWSWRPRFVVRPFVDQRWPQYAALLDQKLKVGSSAPLYIPMNPPWTPLKFDVRELSPEIHVPGSQVVGSLGSSGTFRQTFVSRCDGLDGVLLLLAAAAASSQGALELSLVDDQRQETVASVTMPRGLILPDGPQPFYFAPIKASAGRRYTIVLRAVQNDSKAAVSVLGAANDPYPEGKAVIGSRTDLDASFGYSCARERTDLGVAAKR